MAPVRVEDSECSAIDGLSLWCEPQQLCLQAIRLSLNGMTLPSAPGKIFSPGRRPTPERTRSGPDLSSAPLIWVHNIFHYALCLERDLYGGNIYCPVIHSLMWAISATEKQSYPLQVTSRPRQQTTGVRVYMMSDSLSLTCTTTQTWTAVKFPSHKVIEFLYLWLCSHFFSSI